MAGPKLLPVGSGSFSDKHREVGRIIPLVVDLSWRDHQELVYLNTDTGNYMWKYLEIGICG